MKVLYDFVLIVCFIVGSSLFYVYFEGWNFLDSFFFVVTTITTVGYGFKAPTNDMSRLFTIFVIFFGVLVVFHTIVDTMQGAVKRVRIQATHGKLLASFLFSLFVILVVLIIGALVIMFNEKRTFITGLYFAVETSTTVGFGDIKVKHRSTKVFLLFYLILSVSLIALAFNNFLSLNRRHLLKLKMEAIMLNKADLGAIVDALTCEQDINKPMDIESKECESERSMHRINHKHDHNHEQTRPPEYCDNNPSHKVSKYQFTLAVLVHLGVLDTQHDIVPWLNKFSELDIQNSGYLTKQELSQLPTEEEPIIRNLSSSSINNEDIDVWEEEGLSTRLHFRS